MRILVQGAILVLSALAPLAVCLADPLTVPAADGSDGVFAPTGAVVIDLRNAVQGDWDGNVPRTPGVGIYDPNKFAIVFRYASVNIPATASVNFINHSPNAPVVWLVRDSVFIGGMVVLNGSPQTGGEYTLSSPGPGGFPGGRAYRIWDIDGSSGFGPGGGRSYAGSWYGHSAGYRTDAPTPSALPAFNGKAYGNDAILPLIGGSGGAANAEFDYAGGGAGGGAILIACQNTITFGDTGGNPNPTRISADGNLGRYNDSNSHNRSGNGSGGSIRLIANRVEGPAWVAAVGDLNGIESANGRVRVEAFEDVSRLYLPDRINLNPEVSRAFPSNPAQIWPASDAPAVQVTKVNGVAISSQPIGDIINNRSDLSLSASTPVPIEITTYNVPLTWHVRLHVTSKSGGDRVDPNKPEATAPVGCNPAGPCVWTLTTTIPPGYVSLLARASVN